MRLTGTSAAAARGTGTRARWGYGIGCAGHRMPCRAPAKRPPACCPTSEQGTAGALRADAGVTAIEYALIGTLVAIAIVGGASALGLNLGATFDKVAVQLNALMP